MSRSESESFFPTSNTISKVLIGWSISPRDGTFQGLEVWGDNLVCLCFLSRPLLPSRSAHSISIFLLEKKCGGKCLSSVKWKKNNGGKAVFHTQINPLLFHLHAGLVFVFLFGGDWVLLFKCTFHISVLYSCTSPLGFVPSLHHLMLMCAK